MSEPSRLGLTVEAPDPAGVVGRVVAGDHHRPTRRGPRRRARCRPPEPSPKMAVGIATRERQPRDRARGSVIEPEQVEAGAVDGEDVGTRTLDVDVVARRAGGGSARVIVPTAAGAERDGVGTRVAVGVVDGLAQRPGAGVGGVVDRVRGRTGRGAGERHEAGRTCPWRRSPAVRAAPAIRRRRRRPRHGAPHGCGAVISSIARTPSWGRTCAGRNRVLADLGPPEA